MNKRTALHARTRVPVVQMRWFPNATGYGIVYNSPSCILGLHKTVNPGAVTESLRQNPNLLFLRDHDNSILLGQGTQDADANRCPWVSDSLASSQHVTGSRCCCLVERGDLPGCSFSFRAIEDSWKKAHGQLVERSRNQCLSSVVSVPALSRDGRISSDLPTRVSQPPPFHVG